MLGLMVLVCHLICAMEEIETVSEIIFEKVTKKVVEDTKEDFFAHIQKQKNKIQKLSLLYFDWAKKKALTIAFKKRGFDEQSQKIVRSGMEYLSKNYDKEFYNSIHNPGEKELLYINSAVEYVLQSLSNEIGLNENTIVRFLYDYTIESCFKQKQWQEKDKKDGSFQKWCEHTKDFKQSVFLNMYVKFYLEQKLGIFD